MNHNQTITTGDCLEVLRTLEAGSVDSIVTDPPYALGFMGKGWDKVLPSPEVWAECLRVAKPGAMLLAFGGTRTYHRLTCAIEDAGWEIRDCLSWLYGSGFPKSLNVSKAAGAGVQGSELAPEWDGWGTALKPAWEPIVLAMKPLDGTFAANALAHGVAGLNVDGCRIGEELRTYKAGISDGSDRRNAEQGKRTVNYSADKTRPVIEAQGRWPANVILDEEAGALLDEQAPKTGQAAPLKATGRAKAHHGRLGKMGPPAAHEPADAQAGASRFFYCAKASKRGRTAGGQVENRHPTVKPVELMRWLVRLCATPTGGLVLDPFAGSGSTGVACVLEGRSFLGIELEPESADTARARIEATQPEG